MLNDKIRRKLESLSHLPTIPVVITEVLSALDNPRLSASRLASLIERDQALTTRVLTVANSPFYGLMRRISTIDLAVVILGLNSIKEIVMSFVLQRFFAGISKNIFDIKNFWDYSLFCGASSRFLARRLGYRLAGEAFVAGLMHDIGILILVQFFSKEFALIRKVQQKNNLTFIEAEQLVMNTTHSEIGQWFADRWSLPKQLCDAILNHHKSYIEVISESSVSQGDDNNKLSSEEQPLTLIVAMSEWFAAELGFKIWAMESKPSELYLANDVLSDIQENDLLNPESALEVMKQEIIEEYQKASVLSSLPVTPL